MIRVTYYLEVVSSWCYWAEPAWAELKERFAGKAEFQWKIALMDTRSLPVSRQQLDWFYRRSGTIVRSPFMLNSGWWEKGVTEYTVPNLVAEGAKALGVNDDRVRLALAHAAMRQGRKVHKWEDSILVASEAASLNADELRRAAQATDTEQSARESTAEFHALQVTQRPTFVIESDIADRAVFSGTWTAAPLAAAIESMLQDEAAYKAWAAHVGPAPAE
jgi:predicted DsbA family dithiol-disulfide isomerase